MVSILPDEISESIVCSDCYKYLSVQPVKVYPNRKIKCGRCLGDDDGGVISLFSLVAEQGSFKCINKFEGCKMVLRCSQVPDHEKTCKTHNVQCPLCLGDTDIPTYLLMKHFEREHYKNILSRSSFNIDLNGSFEVNHVYLYRQEDTLFFINASVEQGEGNISLNAAQVGRSNVVYKQKFFLSWGGGNLIETETKTCVYFGSENSEGSRLQMVNIDPFQFINIQFRLDSAESTGLIELLIKETNSSLPRIRKPKISSSMKGASNSIACKTRQPRKIFLNKLLSDGNPELSLSSCGTALMTKLGVFYLYCFKCHEISRSTYDYRKGYFYEQSREFHFICYYCCKVYTNSNVNSRTYCSDFCMKYAIYSKVEYYCSWNCGKTFDCENIDYHERTCLCLQQVCPMKGCNKRMLLSKLANHLKGYHYSTKDPVGSFGNFLGAHNSYTVPHLYVTSNFSYMRKSDEEDYYIWVSNIFLNLKMKWHNYEDVEMEIFFCDVKDKVDGFPARALVINGSNITTLSEGVKSMINGVKTNDIFIKCYLEH